MSIPTPFNPLGTLGAVQFVDEYIEVSSDVSIAVGAFLGDSLEFDVLADVKIGAIPAWGYIFDLGGSKSTGWFGVEHWTADASVNYFAFSNNTGQERTLTLIRNMSYSLRLDRRGLIVNGTLYEAIATSAKNKTEGVNVLIHRGMSYKTFTFSVRGKKMLDLHAAEISGKRCLYDAVNKAIIEVE